MTTTDWQQQPNGLVAPAPAGRQRQGLCVMVHGHQKAGKSSHGDSGVRPTLLLDAETAGVWTPSRKLYWDPKREPVPAWPQDARAVSPDGYWDTCIVIIHDYRALFDMHTFLNTGQHPFNSVTLDSYTEIQQRCLNSLAGLRQPTQEQWGLLLRTVNSLARQYRDLIKHPVHPIWNVSYICGTHYDRKTARWRPLLQGAAQDYLPYVPDVLGWLYVADDGTRRMWTGPSREYETGDRLWGRLPHDLQLGYPGVVPGWTAETMLQQVLSTER